MPVRDIGGISRANLTGVVHLSRKQTALVTGLNVNQAVPDATLRIALGNETIFQEKADLVPQQTWTHEVANANPQRKYTFELRDAKGTVLLSQTEGQYDWTPVEDVRVGPQPSYQIPEPTSRTEDDWLQLGNEQELNGNPLGALKTYQDGLASFSESFELNKAGGRLYASLLRYQEAKQRLELVHARDTSDSEIPYYLGFAYEGIGENRQARESYEAAARMPQFRAAAAMRLAELSAREGNLGLAESYLQLATGAAPNDLRTAEELIAVLGAEGRKEKSQKLAQEWLARFPQSYFLLELLGKPDLHHLGDDANRVLNIASEYMRLGIYSQALAVLSRDYPAAIADESEPGQLSPDNHPLIAYYRGYCQERLGRSRAAAFRAAAKHSTDYVFPSRAEDLQVLTAALHSNAQDANAHYLLGTLYFSKGVTDQALAEWDQARKSNPQIRALHASLGRALLHEKNDPEQALIVFQEGLHNDPQNLALYTGIDQALSILQHPPKECVAALEGYPDLANMPTSLVYELILNLAEAGEFEKAAALFHNRFFQREEGGTNVRQVWLEVQIQHALSMAQRGECSDATKAIDDLARPVADLAFTHDGLEPFLQFARFAYLIGNVYKSCKLPDKALSSFRLAAAKSSFGDAVWAWKASQQLPDFDHDSAKQELQRTLDRARKSDGSDSPSGWWFYNAGMLDASLGNAQQAAREFREALLSPDTLMTYHLTRLAMSGINP